MTNESISTSTQTEDTIVALSTANGFGAIAVIRLSGLQAIEIANAVFRGKNLEKQASHTLHFGQIADGEIVLDDVVVALFIAPKSYTKEDVVEISCHGSPYIVQAIIKLLLQTGARAAKPGEFTLRAFLNGQLDLSQAEAVADLIASDSKASHQIAMQQLRGGFSSQLQVLREKLVNFASLIELELDFGEEDVEFANRDQLKNLILEINKVIFELIRSFELGNVIKQGVNTVIAGRPNAGKSTLLNALLNEDRAIISEIPGTTRDTIEEILNISGVNFRLIDTAGIREATDTIEAIGVQKTMDKISTSALLVYVFDVNELSETDLQTDLEKLQREGMPIIAAANKVDLAGKNSIHFNSSDEIKFLEISAKEKQHIDELKTLIYNTAIQGRLTGEETVITNIRHLEALKRTNEALKRVLYGMENPVTSDFLAMDIKQALYYLGEITGAVTTDDLLENIFSKFCIGK
ncbi:tRNA uridine-5-carboxymethylaminomethyl(34) synthesis GTPase MnmE [Mucilaginibacter sp.]|uniref:tRNA uridine-5-carboxymethylaminomethyl(34) synthesis GTPase MnmE n=1 Tax=Mucilaginibacter sp. TaxID=1882438 RepID=UPI003B005424